ncbi:MAG: E2/UBC family protein [Desulfobulbus sp.]
MLRKDFPLPEEDTEYLETTGMLWETVAENKIKRVIVRAFPVSEGYSLNVVDLNVRIEATYPDTQIDMVYFFPPLVRIDGKPIAAIANDNFDGKSWQRWSRHRTNKNPWRPGFDNLASHLALVSEWLRMEIRK